MRQPVSIPHHWEEVQRPGQWMDLARLVWGDVLVTRDIISVEPGDDRASFLGLKAQKTAGGAHVKHRAPGQRNATDIVIESAAEIPVTGDWSEPRQVHGMVPKTILEGSDVLRRGIGIASLIPHRRTPPAAS